MIDSPIITAFYAGILAFFIPPLILLIRKKRVAAGIGLGTGRHDGLAPEQELLKATRIHGHFVENVPFLLFLILCVELLGHCPTLIHGLGITLILSRILHAIGLSRSMGKSFGRVTGNILMIVLYITTGALCILGSMGVTVQCETFTSVLSLSQGL